MYKRFLLIVALCGPINGLWAQQPGTAAANPFGNLSMNDEEDLYDDLTWQAHEIRRGLECKPEYNRDLIQRLDAIITDLEKQDDEQTIKAYSYHLRRYEKLSRLCAAPKFNEKKYLELRTLIDKREELVAKILQHYVTLAFAQKTKAELATLVNGPMSEEQKADYEAQYSETCAREYSAIQEIQRELEPIEKKLLADHRTFGEKYGVMIGVGGFFTVVFGGTLLLASFIHSRFTKKGREINALHGKNAVAPRTRK